MTHPARHEIEKHARNEFAVAQERVAIKHGKKWRRVLAQVGSTHNIGGYAPALTESKAKHVRKQIIALADSYVKSFDFFGVPSDLEAEKSLEVGAQQIAAGSISAVRGELDLVQTRTRRSLPNTGGFHREIEKSMRSAVNAGKLRLRRQRIKFQTSGSPLQPKPPSVRPASSTEAITQAAVGTSSMGSAEETVADATEGTWHEYRAWFNAKLESLEAMAARIAPNHLPEDELEAQKFATAAMRRRFDEIAEVEYRRWLKSGSPHETFSARLAELQAQVLEASLKMWRLGSDILRQWYESDCPPRADSALTGRAERWEHRARTTEIVRRVSHDHGLVVAGFIERLDKLTAEEAQKVSDSERRLRVWIHPTIHRFDGGYSGEFLERARLTIAEVGVQLGPPSGIPPIDFCLGVLLRELVCERESLDHPQIARLNGEQLGRYLWAPYSGNSITPDSGQILNVCEALKWYCLRLISLIDSPDVTAIPGQVDDNQFQGIRKGTMGLSQIHSSSEFRVKYLRARATLSEQLNEVWKHALPADALWPRGTCEAFFEPFAQFGIALYDTYAEALLISTPSLQQYDDILNFDLRKLVCDRIYPYREKPIQSLQDAFAADARREPLGEWTVRMGDAWRLFDHPRHHAVDDQVHSEFINIYDYRPQFWLQLIERVHKAISRRINHWLAAHEERVAAPSDPRVPSARPAAAAATTERGPNDVERLQTNRKWRDLTVTFISDERVTIKFSDADAETRNYEEMGFGDGRMGKPCLAWIALRELSRELGMPMRMDKKRAQDIRLRLRRHFSIDSSPLLFQKALGYSATFKLHRGPSFEA